MGKAYNPAGRMIEFYRSLLVLYPEEFRQEYARELCLVLTDRCRAQRSRAGVLRVWIHAVAGVFNEAPKEHMHVMINDLRHSLRIMRKEKLLTTTAITTLALGIGAATLVFSLANGLLLRSLPYTEPHRVVIVDEFAPAQPARGFGVSFPNYEDLRARNSTMEELALFTEGMATIRGEGEAVRVPAGFVTEGLFRVLGVEPIIGRTFTPEEDIRNGPRVVLVGQSLWQRRYGGDPSLVGRTLTLGSDPYTVIGIMPSRFRFPERAELWVPLQLNREVAPRTDHWLDGIARIKPGVSLDQVNNELQALMAQLNEENPGTDTGYTAGAAPLHAAVAGEYRVTVLTLLAGVGSLLLIGCANIANLLLIKATSRVREMAVRTAMGASRARLVRQLVTESVLLGVTGGVAGVLLAYAALPLLLALIPVDLPHWMDFSIDVRVLAFTAGTSLLASVLFGLVPAFAASRVDLSGALKDSGQAASAGRARQRLRSALVVGEVGLSLALLIGAGLFLRSFYELTRQPLGYETESVLTMDIAAPPSTYPRGLKVRALLDQLKERVASLPGVESATFGSGVPLNDRWGRSLTVEGYPVLALKDAPMINHTVAMPGYFRIMGITLLEGRDFTETDWDNPQVTIVDEALARQYWPDESAIGKRVRYGPPEANEPWHTIVGVVTEVRSQTLTNKGRNNVYIPFSATFFPSSLFVRTRQDPAILAETVRRRIVEYDRDIAVSNVLPLDQVVTHNAWQERFFAVLLSVFAGLALLLASVGLYGVLGYAVRLRRHEIGIRVALGATGQQIRGMVVRQGMRMTVAGLVLGAAMALALTRLVSNQLYQVNPDDPWTYMAVAALLAAAAWLAVLIPAHRAARVDPITALRHE